jgi:periplasmic divalent cation tolerance protein
MNFPLVVLCTVPDEQEAVSISNALVNEKLAACVNRIQGLQSVYVWENRIHDESEWLLIIKSQKSRLDTLVQRIQSLHSYDVPEIIALPIMGGSEEYLNWLEVNTQ